MKKFKFLELALVAGLAFSLITGAVAANTQRELSEKLVRLHVIANSDSDEDQALKLKVRDRVLELAAKCTAQAQNTAQAQAAISHALPEIEAAAQETVYKLGYTYPVRAKLCRMYFDTREYETFSLPAGYYDACRIEIGAAAGKNWWCVMFPPLCLGAAECEFSDVADKAGLTEEEQALISSGETVYRCKFKVIEWFSELTKSFK